MVEIVQLLFNFIFLGIRLSMVKSCKFIWFFCKFQFSISNKAKLGKNSRKLDDMLLSHYIIFPLKYCKVDYG